MPQKNANPKVDAYIAQAQPFAQPILSHIRMLIHKACPGVEETIKWSRPFFEYKGAIVANMSAFKEHCSVGFWREEIGAVLREAGAVKEGGMGSLGRIITVQDLPPDKVMLDWIGCAVSFIESGNYTSPIAARNRVVKAPKPETLVPEEFAAALERSKTAAAAFESFSPSCRREYIDWIADAKRSETRQKRIATAVEWIAEGKPRNWKYQDC